MVSRDAVTSNQERSNDNPTVVVLHQWPAVRMIDPSVEGVVIGRDVSGLAGSRSTHHLLAVGRDQPAHGDTGRGSGG
ncbi:unnamed protein product, partial [Iphiclides podalirius]